MKSVNSFRFLLLLFLQLPVLLTSQSEDQNLHKYWNYRNRLIHDFVVVGADTGQSVVSGIRNLWNGPAIHYGDAPVYDGYYIATLSTEYRLLQINHQKTDYTLTELYYALEAMKRQGTIAEKIWGIADNTPTGYMLENDVPPGFCQKNETRLNQFNTDSFFTSGSGKCGKVDNVVGGHTIKDKQDNTCSQDHFANVLTGLAFCLHYVGDSIHFTDELTGAERFYSFRSEVLLLTSGIMHYMRDRPFRGHSWILHRPDGSRIQNNKGGIAIFNSYGFAKAGEAITGISYDNFTSRVLSIFWKKIPSLKFLRINQDNLIFGLELSAVGDSWKGKGKKSKTLQRILYCSDYNASHFGLYAANHYGWDQYYGAVWCLLHPSSRQQQLLDYKKIFSILNSAPEEGPFCHTANDLAANGWAGSSGRFYDKPPAQEKGKISFTGNYNGLDYLLFFNCYRLLKEEDHTLPIYEITKEFTRTY